MIAASVIVDKLEKCYLPKLTRNLEQSENHSEFKIWDTYLSENFPTVIILLNDFDFQACDSPPTVLTSLLLLYLHLHSEGRWKTAKCDEYAQKLSYQFQLLYDISLSNLLKTNKICNAQEVFDKSMEILHQKLTLDDFKKYPALIEAYCSIVNNLKEYEVILNPVTVMPVSLLLTEDYIHENRLKGLKCYSSILKCLTPEHFNQGNYHEVVYRSLKKIIIEKDLELTTLVLKCLTDFLNILPSQVKISTSDETLAIVLDQMYTETNLYRKKAFFYFLNKLIHKHGVHCTKRNLFVPVICDNLDICSNESVGEILLLDTLECLENWIRYCWCVWKLSQNKKLMSVLMKLLYIQRDNHSVATKIQNIFIALCKLSSEEEQKEIADNVEKAIQKLNSTSEIFIEILHKVQENIR